MIEEGNRVSGQLWPS